MCGLHQGQECDPCSPAFFEANEKLRGPEPLGAGFFVDKVGRDTEVIRRYIQNQETEDRRMDQLEIPEVAAIAENKKS